MAVLPALFGNVDPNQQVLTQEEIKRRRAVAQQLIGENSGFEPLAHPLQAVAKVLGAGVGAYKERQGVKAQGAFDQRRRDGLGKILTGMSGGSPTVSGSVFAPLSAAPPSATPAGAMAAASAPAIPSGDRASYIRSGLVNRGLPEHVADAFVVNFQDESGLDPSINEAKPLVPGSRGGFGLYQLTGPRRREYEAFAGQRGVNPSDVDAQLDFLMSELGGSESRAASKILGAPDTATAAQAIVNDFLRPTPEHRQSRSQRYAGLGGTAPQPVRVASLDPSAGMSTALGMPAPTPQAAPEQQMSQQTPMTPQGAPQAAVAPMQAPMQATAVNAPQAPPQQSAMAAQLLAGSPSPQPTQSGGVDRALIAQLLGDPATEDFGQQLLMQSLEQQQQANDPMRQMQLQKAQIELQQLQNPQQEFGFTTLPDGTVLRTNERAGSAEPIYQSQPKPTGDIQEYEYAVQQGFQGTFPEYQQAVRRAGASNTNVTVGEGNRFYETLDAEQAKVFSGLSDAGVQGRSKLAQIDALEPLLDAAQTGGLAVLKQAAGEWGINTEGLSDIQAAQALINRLVPEQRQPGSGPMSDADLALFKQSLPRLINQPGGNKVITNIMRGITTYQIQMGEIADQVADRSLTPAQAREALRGLQNPLQGFDPAAIQLDEVVVEGGNGTPEPGAVQDGYRFKGGDPSDPASWEPVT